ncbi:DUF6138 family protein [Brevibacillus sp. AF8]|uniref:DUF6138 family protein n=1 Tax=Brevibacillus sp. AF8 TaxID=2825881 RepID=UPI001E5C71A6|nr:DUF6138 family protein [Brevibacillus sp. AF8]
MNELQKEALEEMKTAIHKWFDEQETRKNAEEVVLRTTLQVGIFNFVQLDYRPGRTRVESSKSAGSAAGKKSMKASPFTREQILHKVQPLLAESGYVDLHDLDEDRQPRKLYIDASEEKRNLLRDELYKFSRDPLAYELAELVPADDMRELAEKAKMFADELAPLS